MNDALIYGIQIVVVVAILFELQARLNAMRAVKGSFERFKWLTIRRITSWAVIIGFFVQGFIYLTQGLYVGGGISVAVAVWSLWTELKYHHDDDDWFNGRWKKITRAVRTALRPRVRVAVPTLG